LICKKANEKIIFLHTCLAFEKNKNRSDQQCHDKIEGLRKGTIRKTTVDVANFITCFWHFRTSRFPYITSFENHLSGIPTSIIICITRFISLRQWFSNDLNRDTLNHSCSVKVVCCFMLRDTKMSRLLRDTQMWYRMLRDTPKAFDDTRVCHRA
jgi:hypothetical protein